MTRGWLQRWWRRVCRQWWRLSGRQVGDVPDAIAVRVDGAGQ